MYIYICIYIYVCVYSYIDRERERLLSCALLQCVVNNLFAIGIERGIERERERKRTCSSLSSLFATPCTTFCYILSSQKSVFYLLCALSRKMSCERITFFLNSLLAAPCTTEHHCGADVWVYLLGPETFSLQHCWDTATRTLQRTATHCNTLIVGLISGCIYSDWRHSHCNTVETLQHAYCNTLQHTHCGADVWVYRLGQETFSLQHCWDTATRTLQHAATQCNTMQHTATPSLWSWRLRESTRTWGILKILQCSFICICIYVCVYIYIYISETFLKFRDILTVQKSTLRSLHSYYLEDVLIATLLSHCNMRTATHRHTTHENILSAHKTSLLLELHM